MKITSLSTIGIEHDKEYLKGVVLCCKNKKINISLIPPFSDESDVKRFYIPNAVYSTCLATAEVVQKKIKVPKVFNQDLQTSLSFQIESTLLYPIDEAIFESKRVLREKKSHYFSTFIAKKGNLKSHLDLMKKFNVKPQVVTSEPHALSELLPYISNFEGILLYLSQKGTTVIFEKDNQLAFYAFSDINSTAFDKGGHALLNNVIDWKKELSYLIHIFEEEFGFISKKIIVTGERFKSSDFISLVNKNSELTFVKPELKNLTIKEDDFLDYALAIGLALSATPQSNNDVNFIKNSASLKYLKKPFFIYFASTILLSLLIFVFSFQSYKNSIDQLKSNALNLLLLKESHLKIPQEAIDHDMALEDIMIKLSEEKRVYSYPYALKPHNANLTEIFAWLNTLNLPKGIQIESIHYYLEKYPSCNKPKDPYIAKCEIEFRSENHENLRLLQEKLMDDKVMIQQGKEFKFSQNGPLAKVSFILKPVRKK